MAFIGEINGKKRNHTSLILEGVCSHCCYCGMPLTDSVSVERGIGPLCSKKGYEETVLDGDTVDAMISLAKWPELQEYVLKNYGEKGTTREVMNCLVRLASLNRFNYDFFVDAIAAIEALGYKRLATTLRESLAIITIKTSEQNRNIIFQIRKYAFKRSFGSRLREIPGVMFSNQLKGYVIPVGTPEDPNTVTLHDGTTRTAKRHLWDLMNDFYTGYFARIEKNGVKDYHGVRIERKKVS